MSEATEAADRPIYVRCRDGALYKNPLVVFREGFLTFVDDESFARADLVVWVAKPVVIRKELVARLFGATQFLMNDRRCERVVPFSKPHEYRAADVVSVVLTRRIPRPKHHEGTERYMGRLQKGSLLVELLADPRDAKEIEVE